MPFRNIGPQQEDSFLAEGMHEEIEAMLSMAPNLMVKDGSRFKEQTIPGPSARRFRSKPSSPVASGRPPVNFV